MPYFSTLRPANFLWAMPYSPASAHALPKVRTMLLAKLVQNLLADLFVIGCMVVAARLISPPPGQRYLAGIFGGNVK